MYGRRGSPFWWMKFYQNGKPVRESTEKTKELAARKAMRQRITALEAGQASIEFRGLKVADLIPLIERDYADRQQRSWTVLSMHGGVTWSLSSQRDELRSSAPMTVMITSRRDKTRKRPMPRSAGNFPT